MAERRGIPWSLHFPPEVQTEVVGTRQGDYYQDPGVMLDTQLAAREIIRERYGLNAVHLSCAAPSYVGAAALGGELVFPEDDQPMIANQGEIITDPAQLVRIEVPDPAACPAMARWVTMYRAMRARLPEDEFLGLSSGQQGPVTAAVLLSGSRFFVWVLEQPEAALRLLELTTQMAIRYRRYANEIMGVTPGDVGLADDFAGTIAPRMWRTFVLPFWERIYAALGTGRRYLHSELLRFGHLGYLEELGIAQFDPGTDQYLTVRGILQETKVPFTWNLFGSRDMMQGTPESIQAQYRQAVADGAPMMTAELCRGTPDANVRAYLEVARELE
jgi:uroporphyrinogen-III decarboxylase